MLKAVACGISKCSEDWILPALEKQYSLPVTILYADAETLPVYSELATRNEYVFFACGVGFKDDVVNVPAEKLIFWESDKQFAEELNLRFDAKIQDLEWEHDGPELQKPLEDLARKPHAYRDIIEELSYQLAEDHSRHKIIEEKTRSAKKIKELTDSNEKLSEEKESLEAQIKTLKDQVSNLKEGNLQTQKMRERFEQEVNEAKTLNEGLQTHAQTLEKALAEIKDSLNSVTSSCVELEKQNNITNQELSNALIRIETQQKTIQELRDALSREQNKPGQNNSEKVVELTQKIIELQRENDALREGQDVSHEELNVQRLEAVTRLQELLIEKPLGISGDLLVVPTTITERETYHSLWCELKDSKGATVILDFSKNASLSHRFKGEIDSCPKPIVSQLLSGETKVRDLLVQTGLPQVKAITFGVHCSFEDLSRLDWGKILSDLQGFRVVVIAPTLDHKFTRELLKGRFKAKRLFVRSRPIFITDAHRLLAGLAINEIVFFHEHIERPETRRLYPGFHEKRERLFPDIPYSFEALRDNALEQPLTIERPVSH